MKSKVLLIWVLIGGLIFVAVVFGYSRFQDYRKFDIAGKQIENFMNYIEKLDAKDVNNEKVCNRGNQKYSDGNIVCFTEKTFTLYNDPENKILSEVDSFAKENGWNYRGDNSSENNKISKFYTNKKMDCYFYEFNDGDIKNFKIGCYGPAKAEYFPVKE